MMRQKPQVPPSFTLKKNAILASLLTPEPSYRDLSPKGSVDAQIKPLIDRINALEGVVTTSSCAGRVSVFCEGIKHGRGCEDGGDTRVNEGLGRVEQATVPGGKGMGGKWLFVSHEPLDLSKRQEQGESLAKLLGLGSLRAQNEAPAFGGEVGDMRFVRFQFEPMVCRGLSILDVLRLLLGSTVMLVMLRKDVDSPHHDRFSAPRSAHSRSCHQRRVSRKRRPESQESR